MKKIGLLNSYLAKVVDDLGHTDLVGIGDLGLPIPAGVERIDLALERGVPSFQAVLDVYLEHVVVEKVYLAQEIIDHNPDQHQQVLDKLPKGVEVVYLSHEELKGLNGQAKAIVRTGEATPYSNIILQSGVTI